MSRDIYARCPATSHGGPGRNRTCGTERRRGYNPRALHALRPLRKAELAPRLTDRRTSNRGERFAGSPSVAERWRSRSPGQLGRQPVSETSWEPSAAPSLRARAAPQYRSELTDDERARRIALIIWALSEGSKRIRTAQRASACHPVLVSALAECLFSAVEQSAGVFADA